MGSIAVSTSKTLAASFVASMVEMYIVKATPGVKRSGSVEYLFTKCFLGKSADCKLA